MSEITDLDTHGKLHMLYGGTKIVQHTPPTREEGVMKGTGEFNKLVSAIY